MSGCIQNLVLFHSSLFRKSHISKEGGEFKVKKSRRAISLDSGKEIMSKLPDTFYMKGDVETLSSWEL